MEFSIEKDRVCEFTDLVENSKAKALGLVLQQAGLVYKELILEFQQLKIQCESYKSQYFSLKDECESKKCKSSTDLKEVISTKQNIILSAASALTKLNETKDLKLLQEIFQILCGEAPVSNELQRTHNVKQRPQSDDSMGKTEQLSTSSINDESLSEIEGTPTGRVSPIIPSKKGKGRVVNEPNETGVKKKPSNDWPTSERKQIKLSYTTPLRGTSKSKLKQARLNLIRNKKSHVVDLTSSPDLSRSADETRLELANVKQEMDNDDTILPSPTSSSHNNLAILCGAARNSPLKKSSLTSKTSTNNINHSCLEPKRPDDAARIEESINLLNPFRFPRSPRKYQLKMTKDENSPQFEASARLSILQQVDQIEKTAQNNYIKRELKSPKKIEDEHDMPAATDSEVSISFLREPRFKAEAASDISPRKPLEENINAVNIPPEDDPDATCVSTPLEKVHRRRLDQNMNKRKTPEKVEPVFKEPTARTKAEKRALPGWSCEECKNFYGELYKDNPEVLSRLMRECSRHRGRVDPARPVTPPGFWRVRWSVPSDTDELNRLNDVQ